ncbi:MAG: hypothetical protein MI892_28205 [Desulfobacterales bacterium]|nr:hypothetical protein [Desulfobacterales bacterium]
MKRQHSIFLHIYRVLILATAITIFSPPFISQASARWNIKATDRDLKEVADSTLTLMAFTVLPDITTSSFSIENAYSDEPGIWQTTLGGGFTVSKEVPLYLEGTLGYSRYDPEFIATRGSEQRRIPVKWNSLAVTSGVGWDFLPFSNKNLKLRPIFNFTLGYVTTDVAVGQTILNEKYNVDLDILDGGQMNAYGLGGSIMLDYEDYNDNREIDIELRYTHIHLESFSGTSDGLKGRSENNSLSLWARWRAPTNVILLKRPLRYVLETSITGFYGPQRGALGFDHLGSIGAGFELDSSAYLKRISRVRLVARYLLGDSVTGYSVGLAVSF